MPAAARGRRRRTGLRRGGISRPTAGRSRRPRPSNPQRTTAADEHPLHAGDPSGSSGSATPRTSSSSCSNQPSSSSSRWKSRRSSGVSGGPTRASAELGRQAPHLHAHAARHEQVDDAAARLLGDRTRHSGHRKQYEPRSSSAHTRTVRSSAVSCTSPQLGQFALIVVTASPGPCLVFATTPALAGVTYPSATACGRLRFRTLGRRHGT